MEIGEPSHRRRTAEAGEEARPESRLGTDITKAHNQRSWAHSEEEDGCQEERAAEAPVKLKVAWVGKTKESAIHALSTEYVKRISSRALAALAAEKK